LTSGTRGQASLGTLVEVERRDENRYRRSAALPPPQLR
jgi:hypothetical protein